MHNAHASGEAHQILMDRKMRQKHPDEVAETGRGDSEQVHGVVFLTHCGVKNRERQGS